MKRFALILFAATALVAASSCKKDDPTYAVSATVTFKPQADGTYFLKQDEETALKVLNSGWEKFPYKAGREVRAIIGYHSTLKQLTDRPTGTEAYKNVYGATLQIIDTIKIKPMVPHTEDDDAAYGKDPIGLYVQNVFPCTLAEDGYLMVVFNIAMNGTVAHEINVVTNVDPNDPYKVELRHNAHGDTIPSSLNEMGIMCFPIKDLPDTGTATRKLTLVWNSSITGQKESIQVDYKTRKDW